MSRLYISLLGPPVLRWDQQPIHIARRQTRALLYRLGAHLQPVSRDQLCFLFWANRPNAIARRNLTHLLTHLRAALPDLGDLLTDSDLISLNPAYVWSDTTELEQHLVWRSTTHTTALASVAALYRGAFLSGFGLPDNEEYDAWLAMERCVWERSYLEMLKVLLDAYYSQGLYIEAIGVAQRYLCINSLDEEIHQRLIELYAVTGNRAAAMQQYRECTITLDAELGLIPLERTQQIYEAALHGQLSP